MSSWFGSSSSGSSSSSSGSSTSSSFDSSFDSSSSSSFDDGSYSSSGSSFGSSMSSMPPSGTPEQQLQQAILQEQQRVRVQQAITKLAELSFDRCIGKPDAKLSSSEQTCITNTVERYLDTSLFVMGRLMKQQQK